jgi:hypothetical protein
VSGLFVGLGLLGAALLLAAFLPSLLRGLVEGWTWLYTAGLPGGIGARRRGEVRSDLWEQAKAERELGYRPESIALHQVVRWLLGVPGDVSWRRAQRRSVAAGSSDSGEVLDLLISATRRLPTSERRVIALEFGAGLRRPEVARVLQIPEPAVEALQHRALRRLRSRLAQGGYSSLDVAEVASTIRPAGRETPAGPGPRRPSP